MSTTTHRLQLPRATAPEALVTLIRNVQPEAELVDGRIHLSGGAVLVQDESPRGAGRWDLAVTPQRDTEPPVVEGEAHGYDAAFPAGLPFGEEKAALDLMVAIARRLFGAVVTDSGTRLEPLPHGDRDLVVTSPHRVDVESLRDMLAVVLPEVELVSGDDTTATVLFASEVGPDSIEIRLSPSIKPTALANQSWIDTAVDYDIVHLSGDDSEMDLDVPSDEVSARWADVYRQIGLVAGVLVENLGGYVTDRTGFLVDPKDLI